QAVDDCGRAIELKPDFAGAYNNRGLAYAGLGDQKQAVNDLKTAARLGDERAKNALKRQGIIW
ncbi:MAG TPA: tetratricopeptide repeat protein, partial [Smithellaceae bacterium]|nr:tetratricopeptide repeat protein [Smithellaceae bacterium]